VPNQRRIIIAFDAKPEWSFALMNEITDLNPCSVFFLKAAADSQKMIRKSVNCGGHAQVGRKF